MVSTLNVVVSSFALFGEHWSCLHKIFPVYAIFLTLNSLGGTPESQREFLETLSADSSAPSLPNERRKGKIPPIANQFALGYTYQDVLDADHDGNLFLWACMAAPFFVL